MQSSFVAIEESQTRSCLRKNLCASLTVISTTFPSRGMFSLLHPGYLQGIARFGKIGDRKPVQHRLYKRANALSHDWMSGKLVQCLLISKTPECGEIIDHITYGLVSGKR
jgi:hypothetical protein